MALAGIGARLTDATTPPARPGSAPAVAHRRRATRPTRGAAAAARRSALDAAAIRAIWCFAAPFSVTGQPRSVCRSGRPRAGCHVGVQFVAAPSELADEQAGDRGSKSRGHDWSRAATLPTLVVAEEDGVLDDHEVCAAAAGAGVAW